MVIETDPMFLPWWAYIVAAVLFAYLIITDIRLHFRVKRLEAIIRALEDGNEEPITDNGGNGA